PQPWQCAGSYDRRQHVAGGRVGRGLRERLLCDCRDCSRFRARRARRARAARAKALSARRTRATRARKLPSADPFVNAYRASVQPISTDSFAEAVERVFGTPESESALLRLSLMPSAAGQLVLADKDDALCALGFVAADDVEDQLRSLRRRSQRVA